MTASLLIVAHGQPSEPERAERDLAQFAGRVSALLPAIPVTSATLALPGALARAPWDLRGTEIVVYPFFMSDGWFVSTHLPRRLATDVQEARTVLAPLGLDPALPMVARSIVLEALRQDTGSAGSPHLVLAAHGSPANVRPAIAARRMGRRLGRELGDRVASIRYGFVDQDPSIQAAASGVGPAICLPLFAAENGHVRSDVPRALEAAGFSGRLLPPIGTHDAIPGLVAAAMRAWTTGRSAHVD